MTTRRVPALRRLLPAFAALAITGLVLSGCGSSGKASAVAGAAGTEGRAAQAFPPSSAGFIDANIDESSTAWKQLLTLAVRFPSWPKAVADFEQSVNEDAKAGDPTFADIRTWLGSEAAFGVLDIPAGGGDPNWMAYAEVADRAGLEASFKSNEDTVAAGTHGGFTLLKDTSDSSIVAISDDAMLLGTTQAIVEAGIDRLAGTGDRLSDSAVFKDTLATLPTDNLVVGYAPGSVIRQIATLGKRADPTGRSDAVTQAQMDAILADAGKGLRSFGFSLDATDKGLRTRFTTLTDGTEKLKAKPYKPALLARVPANSWFAASFGSISESMDSAFGQATSTNPEAKQQISAAEAMLGVKLPDIFALFSGETALYAGPGAPVSAGAVMKPQDVEQGATTVRAITKLLAQQGIPFEATTNGQSTALQGFIVNWRHLADSLAVGSDPAVGDPVKDSFADSDKFKRILEADGVELGDDTIGVAYLDVPSLVNLAAAFGAFKDAEQKEALENLKHVGGILFWGGQSGNTVTSDVFIESQ